jgi:PAS domain S-box-containing protein
MGRGLETSDPATLLVSLARNIPGAIYRCALDRDWTMQLIGEEVERITGYPAEDFVENRRRTFVSLIHAEDRDRVEQTVWEAVRAGRPFELEYRVVTASGEERWEAALYFSASEAITNAAKHARASEICVHLGRENGCVFVEVTDDGVGGASFDQGSGLRGLSDRLSTVSGTVDLASRAGVGTRLVARIPVGSNGGALP